MSITEDNLLEVYTDTFDARTKWRNILLALRVSKATINSIGVAWGNNPDDCYREGLSEWLTSGERSWKDVVKALSSRIVGHHDIARTIERDHIQSTGATASSTAVEARVSSPIVGHGDIVRAIKRDHVQSTGATASSTAVEVLTPHQQEIGDNLIIFIKEKIGKGGFGVVFKGSYRGRPCAVKVLHDVATQIQTNLPTVGDNEKDNQAFNRECDFLMSFRHINVVQHLSTDKHPMSGSTLLVTELMDCNLRSYISGLGEESLSSQCEVSLSKDVASGLAYIHSKKIIHRDLCGDNILLILSQPLPLAKISDFGMSRLLDPSQLSSTLTAIGHRTGYLPNEALRVDDEKYDYSLDVFSFGAIMVQIVCKQESIKSAKDRSFHFAQIPHTHRLRSLIDSCLQEDMKKRPSARHLYAVLDSETEHIQLARVLLSGEPSSAPNLKSRIGKDMPIRMSTTVQSVVIGDALFVGGGCASDDHESCTVMKLDLKENQWTRLPEYSFESFSMTSFASQLILVGGCDPRTIQPTNQIAVFQSGKWTHPYPPMKIARDSSTAVSFNNHIILVGGTDNEGRHISSVEILNVATRRWYNARSLRVSQSLLKSIVIGNILYLMGGLEYTGFGATKMVHHVNLDELIDNATLNQNSATVWQKAQDTPLKFSAPLSIGRSLLAVGGYDDSGNPNSSIHLYQPDSRRWVKVGDLPTARHSCTCSVLPSGEVIVAGGETHTLSYINTVVIINLYL